MRRSRGYLDTLVRSARPAPVATGVRAVRQPDWGPARPYEADEPEAIEPRRPARRTKPPFPASRAVPDKRPAQETKDAAPTRAATIVVPATPVAPIAAAMSRTQPARAIAQSTAPRPIEPAKARQVETARAAEPVRQPAEPASTPAATALPPRLPATREAALDRLEHLARRFSTVLPAETARPEAAKPPEPQPKRLPATREAAATPTPLVPTAAAPQPLTRASRPARVEIGSIEVFVTQPPAPAPVPPSVAPARTVVAASGPARRLSRPPHHFGFGQG